MSIWVIIHANAEQQSDVIWKKVNTKTICSLHWINAGRTGKGKWKTPYKDDFFNGLHHQEASPYSSTGWTMTFQLKRDLGVELEDVEVMDNIVVFN